MSLWLDASTVLLLLASLASSVSELVLLPQWLLGASLVELSHFLCLGLMVSLKIGYPIGVPAIGMSNIGRTGGGRVLAQCNGLLVDDGAREPLSPGVVLPVRASTLGCMTEASASCT